MSRRRHRAEIQFGSDSFLDVVANIVGILIILIVIAGLRVSRTPMVRMIALTAEAAQEDLEDAPIASSIPDLPEAIETTKEVPQIVVLESADEPLPSPESEAELPPLPPLVVPPEIVEVVKQLEAEIDQLHDKESRIEEKLKDSSAQKLTLLERHQLIQKMLDDKAKELIASQKKVAAFEHDIELAKQTLERLTQQVGAVESAPGHLETLQHKITPISRVVNGKEKHYRLEKNRIAEVPIDELIENFREQIERRKDWLVKTRQHEGEIGPIRGFTMSYLVRVDSISDVDAFRARQAGYQIRLVSWEVRPEPDLKGETAEVALRKGSDFYQSILGVSAETTLTFWVYPDSYPLYRKIQKFTHNHGFSIAARPLPKGMHIAGSPNGTKSASQ